MTKAAPDDACRCAVPGCHRWTRRWAANLTGWWICGQHWRLLTRTEKRVYRRLWDTAKRMGLENLWDCKELRRRFLRVWPALVRRAGST